MKYILRKNVQQDVRCGLLVIRIPRKVGVDIKCLNDTSTFLWQQLIQQETFTLQDVVSLLLSEFEISPEVAQQDAADFIQDLIHSHLAKAVE